MDEERKIGIIDCRGDRDQQLTILARLGWITEPTDDAFKVASERVKP